MQNSTKSVPSASNPLVTMAVRNALKGAMLTSAAVAATCGTGSAQAQQPLAASTPNDTELQEVVVTGSRIKQPALDAVSPVTTVTNVEILQSGTNRIEDLLNQLPQVVADQGSNLSNGSQGTATVSLRGLGSQRTLVLIDGRRLMPGDPTQNGAASPDLNQIPTALVDRVDVLTGGASAVYGADAVAGVVNFIMNDHFEGVRIDGNGSIFQHSNHENDVTALSQESNFATAPSGQIWDGNSEQLTVIMGSNFADGKGNATVYAGYQTQAAVLQQKRDFSACSVASTSSPTTQRSCGGSATSRPPFFLLPSGYASIGPGNTIIPASFSGPNNSLYNYAPLNYYQRPDDRYTGGFFAHYDVNDHATAYMQFQFMDDNTRAQIAPSGAFFGSGTGTTAGVPDATWVVNCSNPYLSSSEYSAFGCTSPTDEAHLTFGRRNVEGGPRIDDLTHTSFREVVGLKGAITDAWNYDVYYQNGLTRYSEDYENDVSRSRMSYALQAVTQKNANGTTSIVCAANANGANGAPGCVPWDIFQLGGVTPAQAAYLSVPGLSDGYTQEQVFEATVTGDLGKMGIKTPWATGGLGASFGVDWRQEDSQLEPDLEYITDDLAGQGAPTLPTTGAFNVREIYTEERLPIVEDMPFAKSLDLEAGYRYSDYSLAFGSTNTWKAGLEWAPVSDVRFRGMYNVAVRAPNIQELYLQPRVQLDSTFSSDPCAGPTPTPTLAQCERSGVTAAEYGHIAANTASQYNGLVGGNSSLSPETADTTTLGLVFTPTFLPSLTATVDFYYIKIKNVISQYGGNLILENCVTTGNPFYCGLVHRSPAVGAASDGSLWIGTAGYVVDATANLGQQTAKGIDVTGQYRIDMGKAGKMTIDVDFNYDLQFDTTPLPGGGTYDCAGYYGATCGAGAPLMKARTRFNWHTPLQPLDAWVNWRFIGPMRNDSLSPNPLLSGSVYPSQLDLGNQIPGYNYIDIGLSYQVAKQLTLRAGVNNLMDKDPPIIGLNYLPGVLGNGNTLPQVYDTLGRYIFLNVTADF